MVVEVLETPQHTFNLFNRDQSTPLLEPDKWNADTLIIDAFYQVSVHLALRFQRRRFLKLGQSESRIACGGHVCCCRLWVSAF
jgi:hypothetical protein